MQNIDKLINIIWQDGRIDQDEKKLLKELAGFSQASELSYIRNRSFAIAEEKIASGSDTSLILASLQKLVKLLNSVQLSIYGSEQFACFSPGNACRETIVGLLEKAQYKVDICVFTLSDNTITQAIRNVYLRGIDIRVITDNDKSNDKGSDVASLAEQGIPLVMDKSANHMHHKFAIIDNKLINGSFNWTRSASDYNQENITVSNSQQLLDAFSAEFETLWQRYS